MPWDDTDIRDTSSRPSSQPSVLKWKSPDPSTGTPEDPIMELQSNIVNKSTVPWLEDEDEADVVENLAEENQVNSASVNASTAAPAAVLFVVMYVCLELKIDSR